MFSSLCSAVSNSSQMFRKNSIRIYSSQQCDQLKQSSKLLFSRTVENFNINKVPTTYSITVTRSLLAPPLTSPLTSCTYFISSAAAVLINSQMKMRLKTISAMERRLTKAQQMLIIRGIIVDRAKFLAHHTDHQCNQ